MILTVTPNAAVDKTFRVPGFSLDRVHRPSAAHTVAGGKGINVARVFQALGGRAISTGLLGGVQGQIVARALEAENLPGQFVPCEGETRLCIAVIDPDTGSQTEINERGPEISMRTVSKLLRRIQSLLSQQPFDFVVLSGSLPPGAPETLYAEIIALARRSGVRAVLDTSGPALVAGLAAKPWMAKPNRAELEAALGVSISDPAERLEIARRLHAGGIDVVTITLGKDGALMACAQGCRAAAPPTVEFASAVASGDSFVAGFLWGWAHGPEAGSAEYSLRLACGAGAANAAVIGAGFCTRESIFAHADRVTVTPCGA